MINTNGDYYYVLGKADTFDSDYSSASNFSNAGFMGSTVNSPVGSMFCIWSDYPNAETEQVVAQKVRLPMRAMALRMNGESIDRMDTSVVANGFNADGTLNRAATGGDNTYTSEVVEIHPAYMLMVVRLLRNSVRLVKKWPSNFKFLLENSFSPLVGLRVTIQLSKVMPLPIKLGGNT